MKTGEVMVIPADRIMLSEPNHVCIVVRDVEKAANTYASLFGVGPFTIRQVATPPERSAVYGEPGGYTLKFGYLKTATIVLELVETVEGHTIYADFLAKHGEGIHHVGYRAPAPLDQELAKWALQGIKPLMVNYRDDTRYGWAYMDTEQLVGSIIEIVCDPAIGWWESVSLARDLKGPLSGVYSDQCCQSSNTG